ncbi:MAG: carboxypeptidase regulatory-like domain-containing protein [Candidatus Omnitrophica bacterium]|nr:carboxypeptidase regulatory-like domain-containing protein [Candidatus Omnitrophota bacterium]
MKKKVYFSAAFLTLLIAAVPASAATLGGKIAFEGRPPAIEKVKTDADPKCKMAHPDGLASDQVIVNPNGTLKNVFVYVKSGLEGKAFEAPKEPVVFDQKGCQYSPKVFGIQVNQPLEIVNSDDTLHNVHSLPTQSQAFNLGMPIKGMKLKKTFTKPEVMVKIKCEVHPWMSAWAGVLDHPFFGVSNEEGQFEIKNLPPGQYVIEAWHEKYGSQTQSVTVTDKDAETAFTFKAA